MSQNTGLDTKRHSHAAAQSKHSTASGSRNSMMSSFSAGREWIHGTEWTPREDGSLSKIPSPPIPFVNSHLFYTTRSLQVKGARECESECDLSWYAETVAPSCEAEIFTMTPHSPSLSVCVFPSAWSHHYQNRSHIGPH